MKSNPTRNDLMYELGQRHIDGAERCCEGLTDDVIAATIRWYDQRRSSSKDVSPSLLAWKLRQGGVEFSATDKPVIWTEAVRLTWIETHMPEQIELDDGFRAEVAIVGIVRAGLSVSVERVRDFMRGELISEDAPKPVEKKPVEPVRGFVTAGQAVREQAS